MKLVSRIQLQVWFVALGSLGMIVGCSDQEKDMEQSTTEASEPQQAKVARKVAINPPPPQSTGSSTMRLVPPSESTPPRETEPAQPVTVVSQPPPVKPTVSVEPAKPRPAPPVESARVEPTTPKPAPKPTPPPKVVEAPRPAPPKTPATEDDKEAERQAKEDLIYATIRVRMEEMIQERKDLLDAGRPPHDEKVRRLEGSIMRARSLLIEHGEEVEDVEPPIVTTRSD